MTCIVGMLQDGAVYMAGDHIATDGYGREVQKRSKVFRNGDFIIGYTDSFRMGQLLEHVWDPPKKPKDIKDPMVYMVKCVVPSLIKCFDDNKFIRSVGGSDDSAKRSVNGQAYGGEFLIGYKDRLFKIESDFAVLECVDNYDSIGAGEEYAKGALRVLTKCMDNGYDFDAKTCLMDALRTAESHCALVAVNWDYFSVLTTRK